MSTKVLNFSIPKTKVVATLLAAFHHYISGIIGNREESTPINGKRKASSGTL